METKEFKIQVPEGYEIDKENSTFECIKFKKKSVTIIDIMNKFKEKCNYPIKVLATSNTHMYKIFATNSLMIVAKYLNDGWVPDFNNFKQAKYCIIICKDKLLIDYCYCTDKGAIVYFKREELAQQAIELLGEETIKQALSHNY